MRLVVSCLFLLLALGCQRQPEPEPAQYSVPAEVEPYVRAFREAAARRGQPVPSDNLIVTFGATQAAGACGQCTRQAGRTPRIVLSTDRECWQAASAFERECLVFHELGHCLLNREHLSRRFPKGQYVSLMNPDDIGVYAICRYPINDDACDKRPRQGYYHDELFNPATPAPAWGQ